MDPATRPLFDCFRCRRCCHFDDHAVFIDHTEERRFEALTPLVQKPDGWRYLPITPQEQCVFHHPETGVCAVYPQHPFGCQVYPLQLIGTHVVIHSGCPDAKQFIARFQAGEPAVVQHVQQVLAKFQAVADAGDSGLLDRIRLEGSTTDLLFSFGQIHDEEIENWDAIP